MPCVTSPEDSLPLNYENCTYVNMINDSTFIAKDFFDADHLSEIGAKKLSIKLDRLTE